MKDLLKRAINTGRKIMEETEGGASKPIGALPPASAPNDAKGIVMVDGKDASIVADQYEKIRQLQIDLGALEIEYAKRKKELLEDVNQAQKQVKSKLDNLRAQYGIPDDEDYIFNLPSTRGGQGVFYKESQED